MNNFKRALHAGQPQIGLWQALANPYTAEICAGAGFDWLLLDGEHAPNDIPLLLAQLQAVAAYNVEAVVRLPVGEAYLVKQMLDIGARTLLVPMVENAAQALHLVQATRYPPQGFRGVGSAIGRASRWNRVSDYLANASQDICLLLQVETVASLAQLPEIARTPGVDGVFIGPSDLAASMGYLGNPAAPEVQQAVEGAIREIIAADNAPGILIADEALAERYLAMGALFVAVGADLTILARGAERLAKRFKANLSGGEGPKSSVY